MRQNPALDHDLSLCWHHEVDGLAGSQSDSVSADAARNRQLVSVVGNGCAGRHEHLWRRSEQNGNLEWLVLRLCLALVFRQIVGWGNTHPEFAVIDHH